MPARLLHAAGKLGREFRAGIDRQAAHRDLVGGDLVEQFGVDAGIEFLDRHLRYSRRRSASRTGRRPGRARPSGGGHAWPLPRRGRPSARRTRRSRRRAGVCRPMIERISTDLPVPEPPTTPMISPRRTSRSSPSWTTCSPKAFLRPRTAMIGGGRVAAHSQPTDVKKTAKKASSTMTRKMPCTTAVVVRRPTSSAFPLTCRPW